MSTDILALREDLERFAGGMPRGAATLDTLGASEYRVRWQVGDRAGHTQVIALRSEISLMSASVCWDAPWSMAVAQGPSRLKFMLLRGDGPRITAGDGDARALSGATLQVSQVKRPVDLRFDFEANGRSCKHEELALEVDCVRFCELLGTTRVPEAVADVLGSAGAFPSVELPMNPALSRLFDEVAYCDGRAATRQLYFEAKGLELLAALSDALDEESRAPWLSQYDIDRLESARRILLAELADPPSMAALARVAGVSETKLKTGFRTLFGDSVFGYLRARRMEEAHRLLRERRYSVTEVALRVGYANPSKFAAAFRRHFGVPPARS
jgi:AraC family transcriptional regulator, transcriptional activator of the genes for pyochelin and ferripyochelin receptors